MAYSRWSQWSNWYVYPHSDGFISCHHSTQLKPHTWRQGVTMEEFIDTVRASGLDDAAVGELKEILEDNREEMEYFIENGHLPEESRKIDDAAAKLAMAAVKGNSLPNPFESHPVPRTEGVEPDDPWPGNSSEDIRCDDPMDCEDVEFTIKCKMPVLWAHALVNMLFAMADPDFKSGEGIWDFGIGGQGDLPWGFDFEIESKDEKFVPKPMFPKWYSLDSKEPRLIFDPEFLSDYGCNRRNDIRWMKDILADPKTPERRKRVIQWLFDRGFDKDWLREGLKHAVIPQRQDLEDEIARGKAEKEKRQDNDEPSDRN